MAKPKKKKKQIDLRESAQKVWLAGLGALAAAEKQGDKLFENLVKQGKKIEPMLREPVEAAGDSVSASVQAAQKEAKKKFKMVESAFDQQVAAAMDRMGVASKSEVKALKKRIAELEGKKAVKKKSAAKKKKVSGKKKKKTARKKTATKKTAT